MARLAANGESFVDIDDPIKLCNDERLQEALHATDLLQQRGRPVSTNIIYCLLQLCMKKKDITASRRVHSLVVSRGLISFSFWVDHLIRLFTSCGRLQEANQLFKEVLKPTLYTWNAIISAHAKLGDRNRAFDLYQRMQQEGIKPDKYTFLGIAKACTSRKELEEVKLIHDQIVTNGLESDTVLGNALIDMYAKCGNLEEGHEVFTKLRYRDVVTWGAMIAGYVQHGNAVLAVDVYKKMQQEGIEPDMVLLSCVSKACGSTGDLHQGRLIHEQMMKTGLELDMVVGNTLVDMYVKCQSLEEGRKVFNELSCRDVVSWNAMIAGYAQHGNGLTTLDLFQKMQLEGLRPDKVTFSCILKACGSIGALEQGRLIHHQIRKIGLEADAILGITLLDMYAKCGDFEEAHILLKQLPNQNVESWNALIAGYAQHGNCILVNRCLEDMQRLGLKPDRRTYSSILAACSHAGWVAEGRQHFTCMMKDHGIIPDLEHFNCIIDLLGRSGFLLEGEEILQTMPITPSVSGWRSLLMSCRIHGNAELGRECYDQAVQLDPGSATGYMLMSNIYADAHKWKNVCEVQETRKDLGVVKKPGAAWIELQNTVCEFIVGDQIEPQMKVYAKSKRLISELKEAGYVPQVDSVLEAKGNVCKKMCS